MHRPTVRQGHEPRSVGDISCETLYRICRKEEAHRLFLPSRISRRWRHRSRRLAPARRRAEISPLHRRSISSSSVEIRRRVASVVKLWFFSYSRWNDGKERLLGRRRRRLSTWPWWFDEEGSVSPEMGFDWLELMCTACEHWKTDVRITWSVIWVLPLYFPFFRVYFILFLNLWQVQTWEN